MATFKFVKKQKGDAPNVYPLPLPSPDFPISASVPNHEIFMSLPQLDRIVLSGKMVSAEHTNFMDMESVVGAMTSRVHHLSKTKAWEIYGKRYRLFAKYLRSFKVQVGKRKRRATVSWVIDYGDDGKAYRMRLAFSPRKLGPEGCAELRDFLGVISHKLFDVQGWLQSAYVSQLDVAVDCLGLPLTDVVASHPNEQVRQSFRTPEHFQSEYLYKLMKGSGPDSPKRILLARLYDRTAKLKSQGKTVGHDTPITRIEVRPSLAGKKMTLSKVMSQDWAFFGDVSVGHLSEISVSDSLAWRRWFDLYRAYGLRYANAKMGLSSEQAAQFQSATVPNRFASHAVMSEHWAAGISSVGVNKLLS